MTDMPIVAMLVALLGGLAGAGLFHATGRLALWVRRRRDTRHTGRRPDAVLDVRVERLDPGDSVVIPMRLPRGDSSRNHLN
jgi:hypothetical protein